MKKVWILVIAALVAIPALASASPMDTHKDTYLGSFVDNNGNVTGTYVSFTMDEETGEIWNYMVNNVTVFSSVTYENETIGKTSIMGPVFLYSGAMVSTDFPNDFGDMNFGPGMDIGWRFIHIHDNPTGVMHIVTYGEDEITYTLADGVTATLNNSTVELSGAVDAYLLVSNGVVSIDGNQVTVKTGVNNDTTSIAFVEPSEWKVPKEIRNKIMAGIRDGKVGGEMYVGVNGTDFVNYSYQMRAQIEVKEQNHLRIQVSSEDSEGKVMIINAEKSMLQYDENHKIVVKFDGKEIKETSVDDVMAGGTEAKYAVVDNGDDVSVMVYIPHFSEHTIDVESQAVSAVDTVTSNPVILGALVIVVIAVVAAVVWKVKSR